MAYITLQTLNGTVRLSVSDEDRASKNVPTTAHMKASVQASTEHIVPTMMDNISVQHSDCTIV